MREVPAARAALRILTHLAAQGGPVPASSVARAIAVPRSSVYQLLRVLQDEGFVVHYPEARTYGLGPLVSELGTSVLRASRLSRLAQPLVDRIVTRAPVPAVAQLAVLAGSDVEYLGTATVDRAPTTVARIGVRLPAHLTATGRAMLSAVSADQMRALFPHREDLITRRGLGPATLAELDDILRTARDRGWAAEDGEITDGYASVAAAAVDRNGYPAAAIGLTYRSAVADDAAVDAMATLVLDAAASLTARLAGR
jgi:DNA-binding IclR family transcriptional regulator